MAPDVWDQGDAYEAYVGRWSRRVAAAFVPWLEVPAGARWVDVGCGTGALTEAVLTLAEPASVLGVDPSDGFLQTARAQVPGATFEVGSAAALPVGDGAADAVVSGLAINFVPDAAAAVAELVRVAAPGAVVAAYVWDYAEGMELMRHFWAAAADVDPAGAGLDEGARFPLCRPEPLSHLWLAAGLSDVTVRSIDIPTVFATFDDYWSPFLGGQGAAPGYLATLPRPRQDAIRDAVRERLPVAADGSITLTARAWAVRGVRRSVRN
ncbi:class I SAM-dependent methyltransferase [Jiangella rhizosphaerae]|uniref:Class I SAM-dependent methyltransferase n=1 Tax=Jiangella rhizosphaerae TaxID=2293569 RepID=A0A418KN78_9ACTN|nr:class I SAM-dependent methyltransferase [Jiangella rhizosphaerae]RIQ20485.1 class I SAM-dependent methyltransferase [Jiangella rhizosphaerae]